MTAMKIATQPHRDEMTITAGGSTAAEETTTMNTLLITTADMNVPADHLIHVIVNVVATQVFRPRDVEKAMLKIATTAKALPEEWVAVVVIQCPGTLLGASHSHTPCQPTIGCRLLQHVAAPLGHSPCASS